MRDAIGDGRVGRGAQLQLHATTGYRVKCDAQGPQRSSIRSSSTPERVSLAVMTDSLFVLRGAPAAVVALLAAARSGGVTITRTKIAKLLYLADLRAVDVLGQPESGLRWRWRHYGPFDNDLLTIENELVQDGIVDREETTNYYGSPEYRLRLARIVEVDIDRDFAAIIEATLQELGSLSPTSLRDLTYQTPPMIEAQAEGAHEKVLDLFGGRLVPSIASALDKYRRVGDALPEAEDDGDISELSTELREWSLTRRRANEVVLSDQ